MIRGGKTQTMINEIVKALENNPNSKILVATHSAQSGALYMREVLRKMQWKQSLRNSLKETRRGEIRIAENGLVRLIAVGRSDSGILRGYWIDHVFIDSMCPDWVWGAVGPYAAIATTKYDDPDW